MTFIRSLLYFMLMSLTVAAYATAILLFARNDRDRASHIATAWGRLNLRLLSAVCRLSVDVRGFDQLPIQGGYILLCNHQSAWETMALRGLLHFDQAWILKKELLSIPLFGTALRLSGQIAIDRKAGEKALRELLEKGQQALDQGRVVIVFPEGTRVPAGTVGKFNIGGAMLAEKSGYPVYLAAHNSGVFWPRRGFLKRPGTIVLQIGPAIDTGSKKASVINSDAERWIADTVNSLPSSP